MPINKPLIRKMIKRFEKTPESYEQGLWARKGGDPGDNRPRPACGTTACLAGQAIICAAPTVKQGGRNSSLKFLRSW